MKFSIFAIIALSFVVTAKGDTLRTRKDFLTPDDNESERKGRRQLSTKGGGGSTGSKDDEEILESCGRTLPSKITRVFSKLKDRSRLYAGQSGEWTDICCEVSGLRAELGYTWVEKWNRRGKRIRGCEPWIDYGYPGVPNFLLPYIQPGREDDDGDDDEVDLEEIEVLEAIDEELESKIDPAAAVDAVNAILEAIASDGASEEGIASASIAGIDGTPAATLEEFNEMVCSAGIIPPPLDVFCPPPPTTPAPDVNATASGGNRELYPRRARRGYALFLLYLASPWLLPACHCAYRKEGCDYHDCFEPVRGGTAVISNRKMISDISVASDHYWRGKIFSRRRRGRPNWGTLRACNACPGEETYFDDIRNRNSRKNGFLPVRSGGEPFEECLGYCLMHGCLSRRYALGEEAGAEELPADTEAP